MPETTPEFSPNPEPNDSALESSRRSEVVIQPETGWVPLDLVELWHYRELLGRLAIRDIKVRYKQTELGIAWAILQPLMTTGLFAVLFGLLMGRGNEPGVDGTPYVLSTFCAMLPWQLFSESLLRSSDSLLQGKDLLTKVYFPRIALPLAAVVTGLADFLIAAVVLAALMAVYGVVPSMGILLLPLLVLMAVAASLAVGLWLSALSAIYRDFRYIQPFVLQLGLFVSPVVYASSKVTADMPDWAKVVYGLNPMVGVIEGFRWALLGAADPPGVLFLPSLMMTLVLLVGGVYFFRRMERIIVDVI